MKKESCINKILSHRIIDEIFLRKKIKKYKQFYCTRIFDIFLDTDYDTTKEYEELYKQSMMSFGDKKINDGIDDNINRIDYGIDKYSLFYNKLDINKRILHQIHIDIKRLSNTYKISGTTDISYIYYNILILISHRRFKLGYIQGMADFLVPLVYEYSKEEIQTSESKSYYAYLEIIRKVEFNMINLQGNLILRLREELENIDPILYTYLDNIRLDLHIFSFRWFNCLFFREFQYTEYLRIFTVILAYKDINKILLYIAVGILTVLRKDILRLDYNGIVLMIQDLCNRQWEEEEIDEILKRAHVLYKMSK